MRIAERIARLEKRESNDPRMTPEEIEEHATAFESVLAQGEPLPPGMTVDRAREVWLDLVAAPAPGWLQRCRAKMEPWDLYA